MLRLSLKENYNVPNLETGDLCLGYKDIVLLFNAGPFPGGGDCLIVEADHKIIYVNSNDLIHDLDAYIIFRE